MNEKNRKKIISAVMTSAIALSMIGGIIPSNETETDSSSSIINVLSASATSYPGVSTSRYIEFCSPSNIPVYTNSNCNVRGTTERKYNASVSVNDICYIYSIGNSWIKLSYPTSSGRKIGYIKIGALMTSPSESFTSKASVTVYKADGKTKYGSTSVNDSIWKVGKYGDKNIIIYSAKSGSRGYKLGYVTNSDYDKLKGSVVNSIAWPIDGAYCSWRGPGSQWSWAEKNGSSARSYHLGCDIKGNNSTIKAFASGTVAATGYNSANGNYVIIKHTISGKTVYSFYAHLSSICTSVGKSVNTGTKIGVMGNTGNSYGAHLHFAIIDTLWSKGSYYGYSTYFTGNKRSYEGVTYYSPYYVINNKKLP